MNELLPQDSIDVESSKDVNQISMSNSIYEIDKSIERQNDSSSEEGNASKESSSSSDESKEEDKEDDKPISASDINIKLRDLENNQR